MPNDADGFRVPAGIVEYLSPEQTLVIQHVRLIDGTGRPPIEPATVVVSKERITWCGSEAAVAVPRGDDAVVVDGRGKALIPGLIEAHTHITGELTSDPYSRYIAPTRDARTIRALIDVGRTLAAGFTTLRDMGIPGPAIGIREARQFGWIVAPRILTAGGALSPTGGHGDVHQLPFDQVHAARWRGLIVDGVDACRAGVRRILRDGADFIKIFASSSVIEADGSVRFPPEFSVDELRAIVAEAHALGAHVAAHATGDAAVRNVLDAGVDTIEHGVIEHDYALLERMAEANVILIPTLSVWHWMATTGAAWGVSSQRRASAQRMLDLTMSTVSRARDTDVRIAAGADTESKVGVGENALELELLMQAGLSASEALQAATRTAAVAVGLEKDIGTIEVGKLGEMVLFGSDPLEDMSVLRRSDVVRRIWISKQPLVQPYKW